MYSISGALAIGVVACSYITSGSYVAREGGALPKMEEDSSFTRDTSCAQHAPAAARTEKVSEEETCRDSAMRGGETVLLRVLWAGAFQ